MLTFIINGTLSGGTVVEVGSLSDKSVVMASVSLGAAQDSTRGNQTVDSAERQPEQPCPSCGAHGKAIAVLNAGGGWSECNHTFHLK